MLVKGQRDCLTVFEILSFFKQQEQYGMVAVGNEGSIDAPYFRNESMVSWYF